MYPVASVSKVQAQGRSKPAVRVIWVGAIWICRGRRIVVWRAGSGCADYGTRRDTGGNATPTWPIVAAPVDVDVPVEVSGVEVPAVASGDAGPGTASGDSAAVEPASCGTSAVEPASGETTATATSGETTATAAAAKTAATAASTTAAAQARKHQRRICSIRRRGGDIAGPAGAPGSRRGGCCRSHQPDQGDRRHVKQTLSH